MHLVFFDKTERSRPFPTTKQAKNPTFFTKQKDRNNKSRFGLLWCAAKDSNKFLLRKTLMICSALAYFEKNFAGKKRVPLRLHSQISRAENDSQNRFFNAIVPFGGSSLFLQTKKDTVRCPFYGALQGTRTPGLLIRSQSLYPTELATQKMRFFAAFDIIPYENRSVKINFKFFAKFIRKGFV